MANYYDLMKLERKGKPPVANDTPSPVSQAQEHSSPSQVAIPQPTKQPSTKPISQPPKKFTKQTIKQSTEPDNNELVERPKGFYITHRLDQRLNSAVEYLQIKHGI